MAANRHNAHVQRQPEAFLLQIMRLNRTGDNSASHIGRMRIVAAASRQTNFLLPTQLPIAPRLAPWTTVYAFPRPVWRAFYADLGTRMATRGHVINSRDEALTVMFFSLLTDFVLGRLNAIRPDHFEHAGHANVRVNQRSPRIHVTGQCGFVIQCDGVECCYVEHKIYEENEALFNSGRDQLLMYLAGRKHRHPNRPILGIVTDLRRWQFIRVEDDGHRRSPVYHLPFTWRSGMPFERNLQSILGRYFGHLQDGWP